MLAEVYNVYDNKLQAVHINGINSPLIDINQTNRTVSQFDEIEDLSELNT